MPFTISALVLVSRNDSIENKGNPSANVFAVTSGYI
jgi:hypothetical protein